MTIGTTPFHYPSKQQPPNCLQIQPGHHYYQFRLHEASAIFNASWPTNLDCLLLVSEVASTLHPDAVIRSLHTIKTAKRNIPCQMGIRINLTDWLPARATDACTVTLKYIGIQSSPIKNFLSAIEKSGLSSAVSALEPEWKVALKVSDIVGKTVSYLLQEGSPQELFSAEQQFNISDLQTGYYAALGCNRDAQIPSPVFLNSQQKLTYGSGPKPVENLSYAILQVAVLTRMGEEVVRQEPWWQLLQIAKDDIIRECDLATHLTPDKVMELKKKWQDALAQAKKLTYPDKGYLLEEVNDILNDSSHQVYCKLRPARTLQSSNADTIPQSWQRLLNSTTLEDLQQRATNYQYELAWSQEQRDKQ